MSRITRRCWCCQEPHGTGCVLGPKCDCLNTPFEQICNECGCCPKHCVCQDGREILAGTDPAIAATLELAGIKPEHVEKAVVFPPDFPGMEINIHRRQLLRDGEPCSHLGCLSHISHPCDGCGRVGGRSSES